ncbi:MAG: MBL fold metallo-hydrolase [Alphaproteobacteria bacterium]|nr:MBL fold metallo-hydrolase [Alphaproteobacteria bacterium]
MQKLKNSKFELIQMPPQNTQSVIVSSGGDCVIFDPWGRADDWAQILSDRGLTLRAIYATHGHPDHISAAPALAKKYNIPWYLHSGDFRLVGWGNDLLAYFGLPPIKLDDVRPTTLDLSRTEILPNIFMDVIETPGHTPGGVAYHFPDEKMLLIGDTLFQESIGRYDLPGGDMGMLFQSISNIYNMKLPVDTEIVHGHGMATTIDWLYKNNPYFKA